MNGTFSYIFVYFYIKRLLFLSEFNEISILHILEKYIIKIH